MKKAYATIVLLFIISCQLKGQLTDVITGILYPIDMVVRGSEMYISESSAGKIIKIDLNASNPTATDILTGLNFVPKMVIKGDDLYFADSYNNKISRIDLTVNPAQVTDVITGVSHPRGLAIKGDELYFSEYTGHKVSKIDLTQSSPTATTVAGVSGNPGAIAINGNDLYISDGFEGKILHKDLNVAALGTTTLLSGVVYSGLEIHNGHLYACNPFDNKIHKIALSAPVETDYLTGVNEPNGTLIIGSEMYIAESGAFKISKFTDLVLSTPSPRPDPVLHLFPNPAGDLLGLAGLPGSSGYTIYNAAGQQVMTGTMFKGKAIRVQHLEPGIYFMQLEEENILKFVKE